MSFSLLRLIGLIPCFFLMGCVSVQSDRSAVEDLIVIELSDIHGLWGGSDLTVRRDGSVFLKRISIGKRGGKIEHHYRYQLTGAQMLELKHFIKSSGYFKYRETRRPGIPDEAHPEITVQFDGASNSAAKWANDRNSKFDLVYERLHELAELAAKSRPLKVRYLD